LRPGTDVGAPRECSDVAVESLLVRRHACVATPKHPQQGGPPWTNTSESTETTRASTSRHGPTTKVRGRVSIVRLDSRTFSKSPSIGYAPSEYRTKPWPQKAPIEGWFPLLAREQNGFRVDGTTDTVTPAPRSLYQRTCGSRHTPLSGHRRRSNKCVSARASPVVKMSDNGLYVN